MIGIQRKQFCVVELNHVLPQQPRLLLQQQQQKDLLWKKSIWASSTITNMVLMEIFTPWDPKEY